MQDHEICRHMAVESLCNLRDFLKEFAPPDFQKVSRFIGERKAL
jgi:hypothetical protein